MASSETDSGVDEVLLWRRWSESQSPAVRDEIVRRYAWMVQVTAAKVLRERNFDADLEKEELIQLGMVGLLEAIDRYVPEKGADFAYFARKRVYGAMVDGINRGSDLRAQLSAAYEARVERARALRQQNEGRDRLDRLVNVAVGLAIGIMLEDTALFVNADSESVRGYDSNEVEVLRAQFRTIVSDLPEKQREVIRYHYFFDASFAEVAALLGVSKARISQIHAAALEGIRKRLAKTEITDGFL